MYFWCVSLYFDWKQKNQTKNKFIAPFHLVTFHQHTISSYLLMVFHQMKTFSALMAICAGNSQVTGEFPAQRPVARSFDVFSDLRLDKRLSKQSWGWWFEKPSRPLWRHCYVFKQTHHRRLLWLHDAECFIVIEGVKTVKWTTFDAFRNN